MELKSKKNNRLLKKIIRGKEFPTLVITVGLHGNEPAALIAMQQPFLDLPFSEEDIQGNIYIIIGNQRALQEKRRFVHKDLNRIWTKDNLTKVRTTHFAELENWHELNELKEIDDIITDIIKDHGHSNPVFLDLHTTSAESPAFLPFNDALMNREIAELFPLPLVLGIEEYLEGPLMSHINDLGFPALGFEAGKHDDPYSVKRHQAFAVLAMFHLGHLSIPPAVKIKLEDVLKKGTNGKQGFYQILYRHPRLPISAFQMNPGYTNFARVEKGTQLARDINGWIKSPFSGLIFMPLYQKEGDDGFFIIRQVSGFWLWLSKWIRKNGFTKCIKFLPGVKKEPNESVYYLSKEENAGAFYRKIFLLFGFRIQPTSPGKILLINRDQQKYTRNKMRGLRQVNGQIY